MFDNIQSNCNKKLSYVADKIYNIYIDFLYYNNNLQNLNAF